MLFHEALADLKDGKFLAREAWNESGEYVVFLPGMQYLWKILVKPNPNAGNYLPLLEDLKASDWKVM